MDIKDLILDQFISKNRSAKRFFTEQELFAKLYTISFENNELEFDPIIIGDEINNLVNDKILIKSEFNNQTLFSLSKQYSTKETPHKIDKDVSENELIIYLDNLLDNAIKTDDLSRASVYIYHLVRFTVQKQTRQYYNIRIQAFKRFDEKFPPPYQTEVKHRVTFAKAIHEKSKPRLRQKFLAEDYLIEIIDDEIIDHRLTSFSIIHLVELYTMEFRSTGNHVVLDEIQSLIELIEKISFDFNDNSVMVYALLLKSKIFLMQGNPILSKQKLEECKTILSNPNDPLHTLVDQVSLEFNKQLEEWENNITKSADLRKEQKVLEIQKYIDKAIQYSNAEKAKLLDELE